MTGRKPLEVFLLERIEICHDMAAQPGADVATTLECAAHYTDLLHLLTSHRTAVNHLAALSQLTTTLGAQVVALEAELESRGFPQGSAMSTAKARAESQVLSQGLLAEVTKSLKTLH